jgi:hypothetical protein
MYTVQGHVREQLPAPLLRVPRLVRFSCFDFPANNDVWAVTGDDWKAAIFVFQAWLAITQKQGKRTRKPT